MSNGLRDAVLTIEDLRELACRYPNPDPLAAAHLAALHVTGRIMGTEWGKAWFCEFSTNNVGGMYFRPSDGPDDQHVVWRQIRFAELLFNLQDVDGFWKRRVEWQGHPESAVAELESAFYMLSCGHRPSFTQPDKSGGKVPDFGVVLRWGARAVWEAKAKLETTEFALKPLQNILRKARRQLPKDVSNVVFVRIPERWSLEQEFEARLEESAEYLFRNSNNRAISVLFHWELWETDRDAPNNYGLAGLEFVNLTWEILNPGRRVMASYRGFPSGWVRFTEI